MHILAKAVGGRNGSVAVARLVILRSEINVLEANEKDIESTHSKGLKSAALSLEMILLWVLIVTKRTPVSVRKLTVALKFFLTHWRSANPGFVRGLHPLDKNYGSFSPSLS